MEHILAFDIGGTNIKYGLVDLLGNIVLSEKIKTPQEKEDFLNSIEIISKEFIKDHKVIGVAFSFPGFIDVSNGILNTAGAIVFLEGFHLKEYFEEKLNVPVTVENDGNCVALAEKWLGNAKDVENFVCITIGTGIGGAIFINGKLYRGVNFSAGEFGFIRANGNCRNNPNDESLSQTAGLNRICYRYANYKEKNIDDVCGEEVFSSNDRYAKRLVNDFYEDISNLLHMIIYTINPEKILIGGAITERDDLMPNILEYLSGYYMDKNIHVNIEKCKFKNNSGILGATYFFLLERSLI